MRGIGAIILGVGAAILLAGCGSKPPAAGEMVTPVLSKPLAWSAGQEGHIEVRIQATSANGNPRSLGFDAVSDDVNPVAVVTFYEGSQPLSPVEAKLSHRC